MRTRIKICGLTCLKDAQSAAELGADALGFIFAEESPRKLTPVKAAEIIRLLPPFVIRVGVFKDQDIEWVKKVAHICKLHIVQLHGNESPDYCSALGLDFIKAFRIKDEKSIEQIPLYCEPNGKRPILLDTFVADKAGGTGITFNWDIVHLATNFGPVILSGGLNPQNIAQAIVRVKPFAVDTSSGIEIQPGKKDFPKLRAFIEMVYETDRIVYKK